MLDVWALLLDVLRHSLRSSGAVKGEAVDELRVHDRAPMSLENVDRPDWVFDVTHLVDRLDLPVGTTEPVHGQIDRHSRSSHANGCEQ